MTETIWLGLPVKYVVVSASILVPVAERAGLSVNAEIVSWDNVATVLSIEMKLILPKSIVENEPEVIVSDLTFVNRMNEKSFVVEAFMFETVGEVIVSVLNWENRNWHYIGVETSAAIGADPNVEAINSRGGRRFMSI
jgi:hypothetical protein